MANLSIGLEHISHRVRSMVWHPRRPARRAAGIACVTILGLGAAVVYAANGELDEPAVVTVQATRVGDAGPTPAPTTTAAPTPRPAGGFPTLSSAGVPAGWTPTRTINGTYTINTPGAIVEDLRINGSVHVNAPNVTLRRLDIVGDGITNFQSSTCHNGLTVEDTTIRRPTSPTEGDFPALQAGGYTARNVKIDGLPEGFRVGGKNSGGCGPVLIENSIARVVSPDICNDWHGDGLQGFDGNHLTVRNTVLILEERSNCGGTAPFFYPDQGNTSVDIDGLIVEGGGAAFRLETPGTVDNLHIVDNSWYYTPINVTCSKLSSWNAYISVLDPQGQPQTKRSFPC